MDRSGITMSLIARETIRGGVSSHSDCALTLR
jgi:hypothetical protein